MKISTILDQIDLGTIALPHFQRGFVWNRDQVKGLVNSLYKRYPIGSLLIWVTPSDGAPTRGDGPISPGVVNLLLDGQQRITSLYGIVRGKPPMFFEGDTKAFTGLYFHLEEQTFEFYMPMKMKDDPLWVNVTDLLQKGAASACTLLMAKLDMKDKLANYLARLNIIDQIKEIELYDEKITGQDKTIDTVVEIFNRINSGGTKLSKGDLALAKICASWPAARTEMRNKLQKWSNAGFHFSLEWLLRNTTAILTGEAYFSSLKNVTTTDFQQGLIGAEKRIDALLNLISSRLGLDHDRVLGGRGAIPLMSRYISQQSEKHLDHVERDKLLYWYVNTFLWGRYAGATESVLAQDLTCIGKKDGSLDRLIDNLRKTRGDFTIKEQDVSGWSIGARFYPLLYLLTRVYGAKDWKSGVGLSSFMLGKLSALQVHHIFPKAVLYENKYARSDVNAIANFTFQTQETNLWISKKLPEKYFEEVEKDNPGVLQSHWIPMDKNLWKIANYKDFLKERRKLIAQAANDFLESLLHGKVPETEAVEDITLRKAEIVPIKEITDEEEELILECAVWVEKQGLPSAEIAYELSDEDGNLLAVLDLAWPDGFQPGLSKPVALLLDGGRDVEQIVNQKGYVYFTSVDSLKKYVQEENLKAENA
jgi:hypothetical protein